MPPKVVLAAIAHDHLGNYHGFVTFVDEEKMVLEAKVQAIWWGLCLAKQLKLEFMIVESNSLFAVSTLNGVLEQCPWAFRHIIVDCKALISEFKNWTIAHAMRATNLCAHRLAQQWLCELSSLCVGI